MMDIEARKALKEKIKTLITKLETEVIRLEEATKPIGPENAIGRVSSMDAINNKSVYGGMRFGHLNESLSSLRVALTKTDSSRIWDLLRAVSVLLRRGALMFMPESIQMYTLCADREGS
jgi:DnaK suppressor protein